MGFGTWVRSRRAARGYSLRELAALAGCTHGYIKQIENGANPSTGRPPVVGHDLVVSIVRALGGDVEEMLVMSGYIPPTLQSKMVAMLRERRAEKRQEVRRVHREVVGKANLSDIQKLQNVRDYEKRTGKRLLSPDIGPEALE